MESLADKINEHEKIRLSVLKQEHRIKALEVAERIQPSPANSNDLLLDAQKIYKWLLEGESNYEAGK